MDKYTIVDKRGKMTQDAEERDFVRWFALSMLKRGPKDLEEIKSIILDHVDDYSVEAETTTTAGRTEFDIMARGIVSSLCNAGLAESTKIQRFRITDEGEEMLYRYNPLLSIKDLKKESRDYRRSTSGPGLAETAPHAKKASISCNTGIVAMIDMLGTRERRAESDAERLHNDWNAFLSYTNHTVQREPGLQNCNVSAFSDTMFITADGDDRALLPAFGRIGAMLIPQSIVLGIPIRGCVAAGKFYQSNDKLFTGAAVNEAAAYYDRPQWIGISSCPSAHNKIDGMCGGRALYTKYDLPLKSSVEYGGLVVNWPDYYNREQVDREVELGEMLDMLDSRLAETDSIDASLKWRNTRDFLCAVTGTEGRPIKSSSQKDA